MSVSIEAGIVRDQDGECAPLYASQSVLIIQECCHSPILGVVGIAVTAVECQEYQLKYARMKIIEMHCAVDDAGEPREILLCYYLLVIMPQRILLHRTHTTLDEDIHIE